MKERLISYGVLFLGVFLLLLTALAIGYNLPTFLAISHIALWVIPGVLGLCLVYMGVRRLAHDLIDFQEKRLDLRIKQEKHALETYLAHTRLAPDANSNYPILLPQNTLTHEPIVFSSQHRRVTVSEVSERKEQASEQEKRIASPGVPSFSHLLDSGLVTPYEETSILGYTNGLARRGAWDKLHSFFVVGISGSGKSSTVAYYTALSVMHGARLLVIDPDADEDESITRRIAPLAFALLTPVVSTPGGIGRVLEIAQRELKTPSPYPILWICDEFSTMMRSQEWASVASDLATNLEDYAQRGRKRGRTAIVIGQVSKATRTGGTELRESMTATFIHRTKASQARMVIDNEYAKNAPTLAIGECMVHLSNAPEPFTMGIPEATLSDMEVVRSFMLPRQKSIVTPFSGTFKTVSNRFQNAETETFETPLKQLESTSFRVSALLETGKNKREIILEIWGALPGGNKAYQNACKEYDAIIAELEAQREEA